MLCLITDRKRVAHGDLLGLIYRVKESKIKRIILREKDMKEDELLKCAKQIKHALAGSDIELIIHSNIKVAKAVNADGVHFPFELFMKGQKRYKVTGVSVHSAEEAEIAEANNADYIIVGHIYATVCKRGIKPRGVQYLKEICQSVSIPVIGIGGIKVRNVPEVMDSGAAGIAIMSAVNQSVSPMNIVEVYQSVLRIWDSES